MEPIGLRSFPDGAYIAENRQDWELYYQTRQPLLSVVIPYTVEQGEYVIARDVWVFEPELTQGTLPAEKANAVLREIMDRLVSQRISARLME